jgi:hypothetical protein
VSAPDSRDAREQQRALYGEPLGDLVSRVAAGLQLTQGRLAETIGLSAPMLSQLVSGQRVKIGNPAVVHRLRALVRLLNEAPDLSRLELDVRLAEIRAEHPTLTDAAAEDLGSVDGRALALALLRRVGSREELAAAAAALSPSSQLGSLLREAESGHPDG